MTFDVLLIYVDDILLTSNSVNFINHLKHLLDAELVESKEVYTLEILQDTRMLGAKPAKTPMEQNLRLSKFEGKLIADPT